MTEDDRVRRISEAQDVLSKLNFDNERSNARSALVLLALLDLAANTDWSDATNPMIGTTAIMDWIREQYAVAYKPNTRETIRRQTLHQFEDAGLVVSNPDDPNRPINSPKWCYQVTENALAVMRAYGTVAEERALQDYIADLPGLLDIYARARDLSQIPVTLLDGTVVELTPGGQNLLLRQIVEQFCSRWTPGGQVLYIGDAGREDPVYEVDELRRLGVELDKHGKFPDLIVYLADRNWLVLMEAASSHGPVDEKRYSELKDLFGGSSSGLVFVSCFPTRAEMRKYLTQMAWETDAWCADAPDHLIHFNGERFLGPYEENT